MVFIAFWGFKKTSFFYQNKFAGCWKSFVYLQPLWNQGEVLCKVWLIAGLVFIFERKWDQKKLKNKFGGWLKRVVYLQPLTEQMFTHTYWIGIPGLGCITEEVRLLLFRQVIHHIFLLGRCLFWQMGNVHWYIELTARFNSFARMRKKPKEYELRLENNFELMMDLRICCYKIDLSNCYII